MNERAPVLATLTGLSHSQIPLLYGRSEVAMIEGTKPVKKARSKLENIKDLGLLSRDSVIHEQGLSHRKNGDIYVQVTSPNNPALYIRPDIISASQVLPENACIVTGCCLFGEHNARAFTIAGQDISLVNRSHTSNLNGDVIHSVHTRSALHPYELDTITRVSATANLVTSENPNIPAYIHIPRFEYALYLFDSFGQGNITPDAFRSWYSAVNRHADIVSDRFLYQLHNNGNCDARIFNAFADIDEYTDELVRWGSIPTLEEIVEILGNTNDVWRNQLEKHQPESYVDLSNMANVVTYLSCLANHDSVVGIENPEESKILKNTKEAWEENDATFFCGLYVHPHVFVPSQDQLYGDIYDLYYLKDYQELEVEDTISQAYSL